jgi:PAS domain S-box-containing protein
VTLQCRQDILEAITREDIRAMTIEHICAETLGSSDTQHQAFFEHCALGMARARFLDAKWLDANPAFCRMLGRTREDIVSTPWPNMTHPEDVQPDLDLFGRMAAGELDSYSVEKRLLHKQGHYIWARLTLSLVRDVHGKPDYEVAIIENIGARKAAEAELANSRLQLEAERAWLQTTVDTIPTGLIMLGEQGELLLENAEWKRTWAIDSELNVAIDYASYKGFRPDTGERIAGEEWPCALSLKQGVHTRDVILDIERFNGTRGTIVVSSAPIHDSTGRRVGAVAANMDISELRKAEQQLVEADKRKNEFLAMLSHELRGPLSAIVMSAQLLERRTVDPDARRYAEILHRQGQNLRGLVDELLDVSRITRGLVELKLERLDIGAIIENALESVQSLIDEKDHNVSVTLPRKALMVIGDPVRLEQVFVNLLTNAAKYTDAGGDIAVILAKQKNDARITIRDNGIGMTDEVQRRIFDLFSQAERGLARSQGGLGVGLTIVKALIEQHGGRVEATSAGLDEGSEFVIDLAVAPDQAKVEGTFSNDSVIPSGTSNEAVEQQGITTPGKRILVVDDAVDIAHTLALLLEKAGHVVTIAHDGPSALSKAEEHDPEVILLDIGLPGMDGYEVARILRKNPRLQTRTLAAITGYGHESDRQLALAAGFNRHFTKPVDIDALEAFVRSS